MRLYIFIVSSLFLLAFQGDSRSEYFLPQNPLSVYATDLDLDGDNDIIAGHSTGSGYTNPSITILENNGHGSFEIRDTSKVFTGYQENICAIDVDKDGWPDIAALSTYYVSGEDHQNIRIFYNEYGEFSGYSDFPLNNPESVTDWTHGDINGDGYQDFVYTSNWGMNFGVIYNDGTGHFGAPESVLLGVPLSNIYCCDLDNNGRDDVIHHNTKIIICYKLSDGWDIRDISDSAFYADDIQVADFDQDGWIDVVTGNYTYFYNKSIVKFFKNLGNKSFGLVPSFEFKGSGSIFPADFNNDGKTDLMFGNQVGSFIWLNKGDFRFGDSSYVMIPYMGEYTRNYCCADMDNNGFPDILTVRRLNSKIYPNLDIRFNDGHGNFTPYPVSLNDQIKPETVVMSTFPNPFREKMTVTFSLQEPSLIQLWITDLTGRFIRSLAEGNFQKGSYNIIWDGTDHAGHACSPGTYIITLKINNSRNKSVKVIKMN